MFTSGCRKTKLKAVLGTIALIVPLVFSVQLPISSCHFVVYAGQSTLVSGYISENTTWTLEGSPYIVVGDVVVETDVFLTIEPGVVVKFTSGTNLLVDGSLITQGNVTHPITFTSNATTPNVGDWGGIKFRDSSVDYASTIEWVTLMYSSKGMGFEDSSQNMSHVNMTNNTYGIYIYTEHVSISINNSSISDNTYGIYTMKYHVDIFVSNSSIFSNEYGILGASYGSASISNSKIHNNTYGVRIAGGSAKQSVSNSEFYSNTYGIYVCGGGLNPISNCDVYDNVYGIYIYGAYAVYGSASVSDSRIFNNSYGIYGYSTYGSLSISTSSIFGNSHLGVSTPGPLSMKYSNITSNGGNGIEVSKGGTIHYSNIHGNTPYDIKITGSYDVNASLNWWGTTNASQIESMIYDYYDDYKYGEVFYKPYMHELTVASSPITGITFTIDGISKTTPYTEWLLEGSYTLIMPETYNGYVWSHWLEDGDTSRIKTITLQGTTWTAVYEPAPKPVGGKAIPIDKPIIKPELQIPWVWLSTIVLSLVATVVYIKKRKRNTEIVS